MAYRSSILAKSKPEISLQEHIDDGLIIHSQLLRAFPKITELYKERFWEILRLCIIIHDLGKAHKEFQKVLKNEENKWYFHRHELFSLPFISGLPNVSDDEKITITTVVAGHHKDYNTLRTFLTRYYPDPKDKDYWESVGQEPNTFTKDFHAFVDVNEIQKLVNTYNIDLGEIEVKEPLVFIRKYLRNSTDDTSQQDYFLLLLAGAFTQCDHLSSAKIPALTILEKSDFNFLDIKRNQLLSIGKDFYWHQLLASNTLDSLILTSPTGSGKTETALLWLRKQFDVQGQGRVFYVLPFTASINAMYERLKENIGQNKVGMIHGKLNEYLNNYFEDFQYSVSQKSGKIRDLKEDFKTLVTPYKVITPFQLLKNIFGLKHFEKGMFEWYGSYFIFDEIHAYEPKVFAQIIVFLEFIHLNFKAKILVMTATLPTFLKKEIQKIIGTQTISASEELYRDFKRHKVILQEGTLSENIDLIAEQIAKKKKVLIVCNTVKQAQNIFKELPKNDDSLKALLLHSAFNGRDRFSIEDKLKGSDIGLLVGTQSIEISLDIDYDIIFSEPAPLDALLQRFGRVNRQRIKNICDCVIFKGRNDEDKYIYTDQSTISKTIEVLQIIADEGGVIDELKLQDYIDYVYPDWSETSKEEFNSTYSFLSDYLTKLRPYIYSKENEEYYYKQFDGMSVLPVSLEKEYQHYLNQRDFIKADSLMVKLRSYKFAQWRDPKNDNIRHRNYLIEGEKELIIDYYVTNKKYDPKLGLLGNEEEQWNVYDTAVII